MENLSNDELLTINGGSFWEDVAYAAGYVLSSANTLANNLRKLDYHGNAMVYK